MDEKKLIEKLRRIEALFSGATTEGERVAAACAMDRIGRRLDEVRREEEVPIEFKFSLGDLWSRKLFVALARRHGLRPYRYHRQRYTTVMIKVCATFVDTVLWPEFRELDQTLKEYLTDVTDRVIAETIHEDNSEAEVRQEQLQLQRG